MSEVRQTHDEPGHVYEVLSLQSGWFGGDSDGSVTPELQASSGWGALQALRALGEAVFAGTSRGWDTRGGGVVLGTGG